MVAACDTSFLFSLFGNDVHSAQVIEWLASYQKVIFVTRFTEFEFANALRFSEFRNALPEGQGQVIWQRYQEAMQAGRVKRKDINLAAVLEKAEQLSENYTLREGHRSFDILHIASTKLMKAEIFLSLDKNQQKLAKNEGLVVPFCCKP